jgi:Fe-S-cluster containining protein
LLIRDRHDGREDGSDEEDERSKTHFWGLMFGYWVYRSCCTCSSSDLSSAEERSYGNRPTACSEVPFYVLSKKIVQFTIACEVAAAYAAFAAINDDESFVTEKWRNIAGGETVAARIDEHPTISI